MINYFELVKRLVQDFDPTIDLEDDSPFVTDVVLPIMQSLNHDPFAVDISKFIRTRLQQELGLEIQNGSFLEDILDKGVQVILEPYRREIHHVAQAQSLLNLDQLTDADVEGLAANRFILRDPGDFAQVVVRMYYAAAVDDEVQIDNFARSRTGLIFIPSSTQRINRTQMSLQKEGSFFYWDVRFVAAEPGEQYNVEKNEIIDVDGVTAIRVTNLARADFGQNRDSNLDLVIRSGMAQAQATLVSKLGIAHTLMKEFEGRLRLVLSIGRNDPEMQRDILTAVGDYRGELRTYVGLPIVVTAGVDDAIDFQTDTGNHQFVIPAATYSDIFTLVAAINTAWLAAGGNSYIATPWKQDATVGILFHSDSPIVGEDSFMEFLAEANNAYNKFALDPALTNPVSTIVGQRFTGGFSGTLQLDGIPGGIIDPDTPDGTITVPGNQLHIGAGAADIYTVPRTAEETTYSIQTAEHYEPGLVRSTLDSAVGSDIVTITDNNHWAEVDEGDMIAIYSGSDVGLYAVLQKLTGPDRLRLKAPSGGLTATATNLDWGRINEGVVDIELHDPGRALFRSDGFSGTLANNIISHSILDVGSLGLAIGHRIDIETGDNKGSYFVTGIPAASAIQLNGNLPATDSNMTIRAFIPQTPLEMPVREFVQVEEIDSTGRPTGSIIPYAYPVDIRVIDTFSNLGSGVKVFDATASLTAGSEVVSSGDFAVTSPSVGDRIHIPEGPNTGFYRIDAILTTTTVRVNAQMSTTELARTFKYGSPSVGSVRFYFPDPTSWEVYGQQLVEVPSGKQLLLPTLLEWQPVEGGPIYKYEPGDFSYQRIPEPGSTNYPTTLDRINTSTVQSTSHDFNDLGVQPGDELFIFSGPITGGYVITAVNGNQLTVSGTPFTLAFTGSSFRITAQFTQGVQTTSMSQNEEGPFHYIDAELVSLGTGDEYNVPNGTALRLDKNSRYYNEGWDLYAENDNLTFSVYEQLHIRFTQFYLENGIPEQRSNRTQIQGSGFRITYNRATLIQEIQNFVLRTAHRVICEDPLIRHLIPVFVYMSLSYTDGSNETVMRLTLKEFIENLVPEEDLTAYDIVRTLRKRGATDVTLPVELIGIAWNQDRTISVARSTDRLDTGRNSAFIVLGGELSDVQRV